MGSDSESLRLIAIETSSRPGSIALLWDGARHECVLRSDRAHAADLLPQLHGLMHSVGMAPQPEVETTFDQGPEAWRDLRLDGLVVGTGPGSFTGLRVGIATAIGLARAWKLPIVGVPSLEASALGNIELGRVASILLDARAGRFYFARYAHTEQGLVVLDEPRALPWKDLAARVTDSRPLENDGAARDIENQLFADSSTADRIRSELGSDAPIFILDAPRAGDLLERGAERLLRGEFDTRVEPLYLFSFGDSAS